VPNGYIFYRKKDETYIKITADPSLIMELSDYFTFDVPGAKFTPAYRNKRKNKTMAIK
jgi:hypothetical protein